MDSGHQFHLVDPGKQIVLSTSTPLQKRLCRFFTEADYLVSRNGHDEQARE
jgi:hypothetical protein